MLLAAPPEEASSGDLVVADAVAPLRHLCGAATEEAPGPWYCGAQVIDSAGDDVGQVEEIFADGTPSATETPSIRYAVVVFGGLLGLGRQRIAVPADQIDLQTDPVRLSISKDILRRAPAYSPDMPFSRREEMAINVYFGTTPYWLK